jgi:hypothetical protein
MKRQEIVPPSALSAQYIIMAEASSLSAAPLLAASSWPLPSVIAVTNFTYLFKDRCKYIKKEV